MESKCSKIRLFQSFFTVLIALCFVAGNLAPAFAESTENAPAPLGGPGMGAKAHKHLENWKAMSPEKRYEHATKKLERLKVKRAEMVSKKASPQALEVIDKKIKRWEEWIKKHGKKVKKDKK